MNTNSSNSIETTNNDQSPQCTQIETDVSFYPQKENSPTKPEHKQGLPSKTHSEHFSIAVLKEQRNEYNYSLLTADTERIVLSKVKPFHIEQQERSSLIDYFKMEDFKEQYEPLQWTNRVCDVYNQDFNEFQYSCDVIYSTQKSYYYTTMPPYEDKLSFWNERNAVVCDKEVITEKKKCMMNEKYFRNVLVFEEKFPTAIEGYNAQYAQQKRKCSNEREVMCVDDDLHYIDDKHGEYYQDNGGCSRIFPCKLCKAVFNTSQGLGGHMSRTHKSVVIERRRTESRNECNGDIKEQQQYNVDDCETEVTGRGGKRKITKVNTQRKGSNSKKVKRSSKRK